MINYPKAELSSRADIIVWSLKTWTLQKLAKSNKHTRLRVCFHIYRRLSFQNETKIENLETPFSMFWKNVEGGLNYLNFFPKLAKIISIIL